MRILLLEDDTLLNEIIEEFLQDLDYEVVSTFDGQEAIEEIYDSSFDLLILDVNVPNLSGFDLLKTLKESKIDIPTIFITSLHTQKDMKEGFSVGADDYIKKPFHLSELELRINNIKRLRQISSFDEKDLGENLVYNFNKKEIISLGVRTALSKREAKIFEYLLKNKNKVISIEELRVNNWLYDDMPTDSTVRTYIKNLRKIIGKDRITNMKGFGYLFN